MKTLKTVLTVLSVTFAANPALWAHEMNMNSSKSGLFGLKPEYLHTLLNPLPTYGLTIGLAVLVVGFLTRNKSVRVTGLVITAICGASAWPVLYFGQHGYNSLYPLLDTDSQRWLDEHMRRAEQFIYFFYATAVLAIVALVFPKKYPKTAIPLAVLTFVIGALSLGIGGWIARVGGQVSHSEFRSENEPVPPPTNESKISNTTTNK